ncbi:uncharacterized protein [Physcomitrium patens]|uniref:BHLH domain-containing protein n=1 Tax=Physcomitrium patens TaxID=3218 RepID=A0A2K1JKD9_PHYPA|nr:transcription factor bHLH95-like [Physcomitrium patens]PNR42034.1 hypothetical protein PHYPA_016863 [Physcomitrium patens]|eukprot:XP_024392199.1 transcription factor bHLH95-like [Physcomitrella patens]
MPSQSQARQVGLQSTYPTQLNFNALPPSTARAHCRSNAPPSATVVDMESWFPASTGASEFVTRNCGLNSCQQRTEMPVGAVSDSTGISTGCVFSQLVDFQSDTWWPPITVQAALPTDILTQRNEGQIGCDTKTGALNNSASFSTGNEMESWRRETVNVDVSDLGLVSEHPEPAMAVVSVAPILVSLSCTKSAGRKESQRLEKGESVSAPTSPSELRLVKEKTNQLGVKKSKGSGKRPVSQRENHIWSERERRKGMNCLFTRLRNLLPHPTSKTDKSTVIGEIIKYIQSLQVKLEMLTKKRQQVMAAVLARPGMFVSNNSGLTLVDHSNFDPSSMTAITALPPPGKESCLQSYLGTNVGLHVCGLNVFITTSSPRGRQGLLQQLLVTIHKHQLDVINATISTSSTSVFHCLHCQASQNAEVLNNDLHSALQSIITNFGLPQY